ncbi:GNAT family N-acetyltransferase [Paenibacillus tarimensis]
MKNPLYILKRNYLMTEVRGVGTMVYLKQVEEFSADVTSVMAQCIYNPDSEKMSRTVKAYKEDPLRSVYAYYEEMESEAAAIIGLRLIPEEKFAVILHVAVDHKYREKGIGRKLIDEIISLHDIRTIEAETDKDAVHFYRACGFSVRSLGEKYPGVERFLCTKIMSL